jgi:uncharacterized membrane protein YfcA
VLGGRNVLAVMPTGAGKSLCYQRPALVLGGLSIVVSPLVALMRDQVAALRLNGIAAATINSDIGRADNVATWRAVRAGEVRLLYLSPERLMTEPMLSALLGALLVVYATMNLAGLRLAIPLRQEVWIGPLLGTANGILTGMTGSFVVPGVLFLQAIGLSRDMLIQAMGMLFTVSALALAIALQGNGLLSLELGKLSAAALLPALVGMAAGQRIRQRLSEQLFRRVFFVSLLILGTYIIASAIGSRP